MKKSTPYILVAALTVLTAVTTKNADAESIGINFTGNVWFLQPTDQPGVVAGANWNNVSGASGANVNLHDSTGSSTAALLTFTSTGNFGAFLVPRTPNVATNMLYSGGLVGNDTISEVTVSLTDIPYATYDVYVYASQEGPLTNILSITDGITTFYYCSNGENYNDTTRLIETTSNDVSNPTRGAPQYQVFHGLSNSSFSLTTGGSLNCILSNNVYGLQVVSTEAADPVVSNVKSRQIPGTHKVNILYDLAAGSASTVAVQVSEDGGASYGVVAPPEAFTGAIGAGVLAGTGKSVVFDAATSGLNHLFSKQIRFRVTASCGPLATEGFALIPAGSFQMGDALGDGYSAELPVHTVQVSAFYMAKYEVTKALWDEVREWGASHGYTDLPTGGGKAANHPVHSISWWAMVKWCNARSEKEGLTPCYYTDAAQTVIYRSGETSPDNTMVKWSVYGYRLPTEAEWEKAARGGLSGKRFPWGNAITHSEANFWNNGVELYQSGSRGPHPIWSNNNDGNYPYASPAGSFAANGYGLYDMAGNAWEWCWDRYDSYSAASQVDPRGAVSGSIHVVRGGGWDNHAEYTRCSGRFSNWAYSVYGISSGFRLARGQP